MTDAPASASRAHAYDPDPGCSLCGGLGVRHVAMGLTTARVSCPCTLIGPANLAEIEKAAVDFSIYGVGAVLITDEGAKRVAPGDDLSQYAAAFPGDDRVLLANYRRHLSELPPIKDTAVLDQYPDCQPRTPIDPPTTITGVIFKGNTDLPPSVRSDVSALRDCTACGGRGVSTGVVCKACKGKGWIAR